jgi:hypothetical protein
MNLIFRAGLTTALLVVSTSAFAQAPSPVAVPLVGSPAAQTPPSTQPEIPNQAPPAPTQMPVATPPVPAQPPSMPANSIAAAPLTGRGERKLDLSFNNGTVTLNAQNVTVREVVTEWQRRGGCQFVHADQLPATPVTLQLPAGTPELEALDSLFRALATPSSGYGYIVAPAADRAATRSNCGAVYILASSHPSATASYAAVPAQAPIVSPIRNPDDEIPPVTPFPPIQRPPAPGQPGSATGPAPAPETSPAPAAPLFAPVAPSAPGVVPLNPATPPPAPGNTGGAVNSGR